jgi:hypothetical protein
VAGGIAKDAFGHISVAAANCRTWRPPRPRRPRIQHRAYDRIGDNPFRRVTHDPLSTFSSVDSLPANVRRFLNGGTLPRDAVRIEDSSTIFASVTPAVSGQPFSVTTEIAACPGPEAQARAVGLRRGLAGLGAGAQPGLRLTCQAR